MLWINAQNNSNRSNNYVYDGRSMYFFVHSSSRNRQLSIVNCQFTIVNSQSSIVNRILAVHVHWWRKRILFCESWVNPTPTIRLSITLLYEQNGGQDLHIHSMAEYGNSNGKNNDSSRHSMMIDFVLQHSFNRKKLRIDQQPSTISSPTPTPTPL